MSKYSGNNAEHSSFEVALCADTNSCPYKRYLLLVWIFDTWYIKITVYCLDAKSLSDKSVIWYRNVYNDFLSSKMNETIFHSIYMLEQWIK